MTTISIPNNGWKKGTCGWLAAGLQGGSITITPGTSKSGKGGLWLRHEGKSHCLAIFNEFDLSEFQYSGANRFNVAEEGFCDELPLTVAAEAYLKQASKEWCDSANEGRDNDRAEMPTVAIVG